MKQWWKRNINENMPEEAWERYSPFFEFKPLLTSRRYCRYVDACIQRSPVPRGMRAELIDRRYFYEEESVGDYACGIAREAIASQLRLYGRTRFGNTAL
jgi:hypothetical protein